MSDIYAGRLGLALKIGPWNLEALALIQCSHVDFRWSCPTQVNPSYNAWEGLWDNDKNQTISLLTLFLYPVHPETDRCFNNKYDLPVPRV